MRARMALHYAQLKVEIREIALRDKPQAMLLVSPKGTVPVLVLPDGSVLEQSLDIMHWALKQYDPDDWALTELKEDSQALIDENDGAFKHALDRYKYPERFPEFTQLEYRLQGEVFLQKLERLLETNRYLLAGQVSMADIAIFPFIRQFAAVDADWFAQAPYLKLRAWLNGLVESKLFDAIMQKHTVWQE